MVGDHLSLQEMAQMVSLEQEPDLELRRKVERHLVDLCPVCKERYERVKALKRTVGHYSEQAALDEWSDAPELWGRLEPLEQAERLARLEDDSFHTWGLCRLLEIKSIEAAWTDAVLANQLAELALAVWEHLLAAYDTEWLADLKARALACLGNARRAGGELGGAEEAFGQAHSWLERGTGSPAAMADVISREASLRRARGEVGEALELLARAHTVYTSQDEECADPALAAEVLMRQASCRRQMGDAEEALEIAASALEIGERESVALPSLLRLYVERVWCLIDTGRQERAEELLPRARELARGIPDEGAELKLRWAEGRIAFGRRDEKRAEELLVAVRQELERRERRYEGVQASLDLIWLLLWQDRLDEAKGVWREVVATLECGELGWMEPGPLLVFGDDGEVAVATFDRIEELANRLRWARAIDLT